MSILTLPSEDDRLFFDLDLYCASGRIRGVAGPTWLGLPFDYDGLDDNFGAATRDGCGDDGANDCECDGDQPIGFGMSGRSVFLDDHCVFSVTLLWVTEIETRHIADLFPGIREHVETVALAQKEPGNANGSGLE